MIEIMKWIVFMVVFLLDLFQKFFELNFWYVKELKKLESIKHSINNFKFCINFFMLQTVKFP